MLSVNGTQVLIDQVYQTDAGLVALETGWNDPMRSRTATHILPEPVTGNPKLGWRAGDLLLWILEDDDDRYLLGIANDWRKIRERTGATREAGARFVEADLLVAIK